MEDQLKHEIHQRQPTVNNRVPEFSTQSFLYLSIGESGCPSNTHRYSMSHELRMRPEKAWFRLCKLPPLSELRFNGDVAAALRRIKSLGTARRNQLSYHIAS